MPFVPPAGVSPLSAFLVGTADVDDSDPPVILADAIDVATGEYLSLFRGFDPTDAAILLSFQVRRGSGSAVEDVGQNFADHPRVDEQLESFMREEVRLCTKTVVDRGDAKIDSVTVTPQGDGADTIVKWQNLARQKQGLSAALPSSLLVVGAA